MDYKEDIVWIAMADKTRRDIIDMLYKKDSLTAGEISEKFEMTKPSLSRHFNILKQAGLINAEKKGKNVIYTLSSTWGEEILAFTDRIHNREPIKKLKKS